MAGIDNAIYDKIVKKKWYQQEFLVSGTFVAPVDGVYFITGCGGGAGGGYTSSSSVSGGGGAGCFKYPVYLSAGTSVTVTIGAGGRGSATNTKNAGGNTAFGSYVVLNGAAGGTSTSLGGLVPAVEVTSDKSARQMGFFFCGASGGFNTSTLGSPGNSTFERGLSVVTVGGGAGGFFGVGGDSSTTGNGGNAPDNSGAGGGSTTASTFSGGNGGSGRLIVQWQE